jgi:hypothetical protein
LPANEYGLELPNIEFEIYKSFMKRYQECLNSDDDLTRSTTRHHLKYEAQLGDAPWKTDNIDTLETDEHKFLYLLKKFKLKIRTRNI